MGRCIKYVKGKVYNNIFYILYIINNICTIMTYYLHIGVKYIFKSRSI